MLKCVKAIGDTLNRWVFFKIFALILALMVVVYFARDLQNNGIDPALLGFTEEEINQVVIICSAPPIRASITAKTKTLELSLQGPSWVADDLSAETLQKFELGLESICTQRKDKTVDITGLQKPPKFEETIEVTLLDKSKIIMNMTEAGLVQIGNEYYLNTDFINAVEAVMQ